MFKNLNLNPIYSTYNNDIIEEFYNPILKEAIKFDRISAYFSSKALAFYSRGLEYFARHGYKYRIIISENISVEDYKLIKKGYRLKSITNCMMEKLREEISLAEEKDISNLAYLISIGVVDIKIAFVKQGIFHDKCGIFYDNNDNVICFRGSNNETVAAINNNYEAFTVTCSWVLDSLGFYEQIITKSIIEFEKLWNNIHDEVVVLRADDVIMNEILKHNKNEIIIEETLLQDNCVILDYTNRLVLRINMKDRDWIVSSAFYKLKLKRFVDYVDNVGIYFKDTLSYIDYQKINAIIKDKADSLGNRYYTTKRLLDYIEAKNIYIEKRSSLGIDIKKQDEKLYPHFLEYSNIVNDNMDRKLRDKQMWDSFYMCAMIKSGNFSVPGSGKTASVLGVYAFLKSKGLVKRIVMIGPKNAFGSWIDEFNICFKDKEKLRLFNIHDSIYRNKNEKKRALKYDTGGSNLLLFNYECLGTYIDEINLLIDENTLLVFDEVHKVKRVEGDVPGIYAGYALNVAKNSVYSIVMTGTPIPNSYVDLYNILHILYNDEYNEFFGFNTQMLKSPTEQEINMVNNKIQPFFCRTTKQQLQVPKANNDNLIYLNTSYEEQTLFKILTEKYRKNKFVLFIRLLQLESNPEMILKSLDLKEFEDILDINDNIDDIDYVDYSSDVKELISSIDITTKMKATVNLTSILVNQGKKIIIWCIFKNSINKLHSLLGEIGIKTKVIYGEVELNDRLKIIDEFKNNKFDVLLTNPHTLAESVSLHSICHDAIYFEFSYNLVHLLQSKDRIHRLGLPDNQYTQYHYMLDTFMHNQDNYSIDEQVYTRLMEKEQVMINAIENNELEDVTTPEEDLDIIFKKLFK
jgi:SNF2 family DNA or RNA helicase